MLNSIRETLGYALYNCSYPFYKKKLNILSIYFHKPSPKLFTGIIKWLKKNSYEIISLEEFNNKQIQSENSKIAILTFDDGWRSNLELVPIINKYNIPITIFIATEAIKTGNFWWEYALLKDQQIHSGINSLNDFKKLDVKEFDEKINILKREFKLVRKAMTIEELKTISKNKNVTIGAHTVSHPILINCSINRITEELYQSKQDLELWCNMPIKYFSYPNGDSNDQIKSKVKEIGYKMAFSTQTDFITDYKFDKYWIPRLSVNDYGGYWENMSKIIGAWQKIF